MPVLPEIQTLLDQIASLGGPALSDLEPAAARELLASFAQLGGDPRPVGSVVDRTVPGPAGDIPVRVYAPGTAGVVPVLVWYHGGGWVIGDLDTTDHTARALCAEAGVVVVSVDYRLAPEGPFPAAVEDAWAALSWVAAHGAEIGADPTWVAVGGDSAGGNLAALVAIRARDEGMALRHQLLVYPATDLTMSHPSIDSNGEGYFLTKADMLWFTDHYLGADRQHGDPASPEVSPLHVADLSGVAPAQVLTAEFDPLRDEGDAYAARLTEAGVAVDHVPHPGLVHGFFGMGFAAPAAAEAVSAAAARLAAAKS